MTAFVVFGCSYHKLLLKAKSEISTRQEKRELTADEWEALCHGVAGVQFKAGKPSRISKKFGAPQFCKDFIALCDAENFINLSVYAFQKTGKLVAKGKKKGQDAYGWLPYKPLL